MAQERHRLVFVDEDRHDNQDDEAARPRPPRRAVKASASFSHWATQTFIAALRCDGLTAPWIVDRPMDRKVFDAWVETSSRLPSGRETSSFVLRGRYARRKRTPLAGSFVQR